MKILKYGSIINVIGYLFIFLGISQLFSSFISALILIGLGIVMTKWFTKLTEHFNIDFSNKKRIILGIALFLLFGFTAPETTKPVDSNKNSDVAVVDTKKIEQKKKDEEEKKKQQEAKEQAKLEAEKQAQAHAEAERIAQEQAAAEAQKAQEAELARQQAQAAQEAAMLAEQQRQAQEAKVQAETQARNNSPIAQSYIANVNTKKFHQSGCSYLPEQKNQRTFSSRNEAINAGYDPCKKCNP